jgi:hypothetical protein
MYKKMLCALLISTFMLSLILSAPVLASTVDNKGQQVYSYLASFDDKAQAKPGKPSATATVSLQNIPSGDYLLGTVTIIAQASGAAVSKVYYSVDSGSDIMMSAIDSTGRYQAQWITTGLSNQHTLTVKAKNSAGNVVASSSAVTVTIVSSPKYEVRYEIDCLTGYTPTDSVLNYLTGYWLQHATIVTFTVDDTGIADPSGGGYISSADFWSIENTHNDGPTNSVKYSYQYTLADKWMLYGSFDSNLNVGGYTYMTRSGSGGNYIFICDGMIQNWQTTNNIGSAGGELIVTGHEAGHSIGILVGGGGEKYDTDYYSIMSLMRMENAKYIAPYWYYSGQYWATANLNYYPAAA